MKNVLSKVALAALAAAGGAVTLSSTANAQEVTQSWTGTVAEDRAGEARFKMRGRFQFDIYSNEWDVLDEDASRSYVRRAFLGVQGRLSEHWRYKLDFVLNPGSAEGDATGGQDVAVDDAYLEYAGDFYSIVIGENNVTSPLEDRISSLDIPFNERSSFINTFGYGRAAGIAGLITGANWMGTIGVYGDSLNNQDSSFAADEQSSVSGRFTWAPLFAADPDGYSLIHLGVSARQRHIGDDAGQRFRTRPLNGRGTRWIDGGSAAANLGESDTTIGAELAGQFGPFGFQAEYSFLDGTTITDVDFDSQGYYVDLYWSITGEPRAYRGNQGSFGPIAPARPVTQGGPGHLMLSARYDFVDLTDTAFAIGTRGEQSAYALGLDWVPIDHVRFKLNYAFSEADRTGTGTDEEAQVLSLRTQFDF
jgi:phosphate-selective porin OprO and OprP